MTQPALHLIPVPLSELSAADPAVVLPASVLPVIRDLRHFVVENAKSARAFLKSVGMPVPIAELDIRELPGRGKIGKSEAQTADWDTLLAPLASGTPIGLLSEAGCPAVADPGSELVRRAHERAYRVVPHIGPSSILLALMASGLSGQRFAFHGYLPQDENERKQAINRLENVSKSSDQTQIVIETPYRNTALFESLLDHLRPETRLCIAMALTTPEESICTRSIRDWKKQPMPSFEKRPTVFLFKQ
jgi:16S rRNA (cytidine1402-2'-O)-methyltransferase